MNGYVVEYDTANQPPVAAFSATPLQGPVPLTVKFADQSTGEGITSRVWQYKLNNSTSPWATFILDGTSSHKFSNAGSYDIKLTVTGTGGSDDEIKLKYISVGCDFSTQPGIERCFGGIGINCEGTPGAPFTHYDISCMMKGKMSVGSILHDRCCLSSGNTGVGCAKPETNECQTEWDEAVANTVCTILRHAPRQWSATFGPYWFGNTGDFGDVPKADLSAPSGTRVKPVYQNLCSSGSCRVDKNGNTILEKDGCGQYCVCK